MSAWRSTPSPARMIVLLGFLSVVVVCHGALTSETTFTEMKRGKRLLGTTYLTLDSCGVIRCAKQCKTRGKCQSFHYDLTNLTCYLNEGAASGGVALEDDAEYLYGEEDQEKIKDVVGGCDTTDCASNQQCVTDANDAPRCIYLSCPSQPPAVAHSQFLGMDTEAVGGIARFECDSLYRLETSSLNLTCLTTGQWLDPRFKPACKGSCGEAPVVANSSAGPLTAPIGTSHTYVCHEGYQGIGSNPSTTCQGNLTWTLPDFTCANSCGEAPVVANSPAGPLTAPIGTNHTYVCHEGYQGIGSNSSTTCQGNLTWTLPDFTCANSCGEAPVVANSPAGPLTAPIGTSHTYVCHEGYQGIGSNSSTTCQGNLTWTLPDFTCASSCGEAPVVANSPAGPLTAPMGTNHTYVCHEGYQGIGSNPSTTCQGNLTWTLPDFTCAGCNETFPSVPNSEINYNDSQLGYNATFECNLGYLMNGTGLLSCLDNGIWDSVDFTCEKVNFTESVSGFSGALISRNYPDPYPASENVSYIITLPSPGQNVSVAVWYTIQSSDNCTSDYLTIGDSEDRYCGNSTLATVLQVPTSSISVNFISDCCDQQKGFFLRYNVV